VADVLLDTDVLIDHLRGARRLDPGADTVSYSVVTRMELFAGHASQNAAVTAVLAPFRELPVERSVAELAGRLRRDHGLRVGDALIAATALVHRLALATRNVRDFEGVPKLRLHRGTR
jgi:toxin FitB